ncbi:Uricase [Metarhizium anisopliae]
MPYVSAARYGKDNVRVLKVTRDQTTGVQTVTEMTVCCLLEGDIDTSYTEADNSVVVATDSIKNTTFIIAKQHPVNPPELTGSAFHGFIRDEYTTLPETWDRILSTDVDASWKWAKFADLKAVEESAAKFDKAWDSARNITLKLFAEDNSASVQNTMYKMCEQILDAVPETEKVAYSLPNKHNFELDLSWHNGLKNTGKDAEVYVPQTCPNGLIKCEVSRS